MGFRHRLAQRLQLVGAVLMLACCGDTDGGVCSWVSHPYAPVGGGGRESAPATSMYAVTAADDGVVAVGMSNYADIAVLMLCDGQVMVSNAPAHTGALRSVAYGNDTLVAVGSRPSQDGVTPSGGLVLSRQRGDEWRLSEQLRFDHVVFGNGVFVASTTTSRIPAMVSRDGVKWTAIDAAGQVFFDGDRFVAYEAGGGFSTSTDGRRWSPVQRASMQFHACQSFSVVGDRFVGYCTLALALDGMGGEGGAASDFKLEGARGSAPHEATISKVDYSVSDIAISDTRAVTLPDLMSMPNPLNDNQRQGPIGDDRTTLPLLYDILYDANQFVAVGQGIVTSEDGLNWARSAYP